MPFAPYTGYVPCSQTSLPCRVEDLHSKHSDKRTLGLLLRTIFCAIPLIKDCNLSMILLWVAMRSSRRDTKLAIFSCSFKVGKEKDIPFTMSAERFPCPPCKYFLRFFETCLFQTDSMNFLFCFVLMHRIA